MAVMYSRNLVHGNLSGNKALLVVASYDARRSVTSSLPRVGMFSYSSTFSVPVQSPRPHTTTGASQTGKKAACKKAYYQASVHNKRNTHNCTRLLLHCFIERAVRKGNNRIRSVSFANNANSNVVHTCSTRRPQAGSVSLSGSRGAAVTAGTCGGRSAAPLALRPVALRSHAVSPKGENVVVSMGRQDCWIHADLRRFSLYDIYVGDHHTRSQIGRPQEDRGLTEQSMLPRGSQ